MTPNTLYYGDNLDVLRRHVKDESVDLVYLDPPFNSNANYNVLFAEHGEKAAAQVKAFTDTWEWNTEARAAYEEVVESGGRVAEAMRAFRTLLGASDMLAYLSMMAPRLVELRRVLRPTGSLYLHCDPTASHYLKLLLDGIFGPQSFRNEIAWKRTSAHNDPKRYGRVHDVLLFYSRSPSATWNAQFAEKTDEYLKSHDFMREPDGRLYRLRDLTAPAHGRDTGQFEWNDRRPPQGRMWAYTEENMHKLVAAGLVAYTRTGYPRLKRYVDELPDGVVLQDVWTDINPINSGSREKLGYPTQKPLALLDRIVNASSNPGDIVLDPFCGCGTAIDAAQGLGRRWIGIDITHLSIGLIKHRLVGRYGPEIASTYRVVGEPTTADDAAVLAREDPFQFQAWALGLVGARIAGSAKKGGDKGIDGKLYFHYADGGPTKQVVFSVKAGKLVPAYVRDLRGVLERESAEIGVLLSFEEPSAGMRSEAAEAGFYESPWGRHPRIQLRTIRELLDGKGIDYPHVTGANVTHRRAQRARAAGAEAIELFGRAAEKPESYGSE
ncbi:site-specific DNA-methyltransferase [soil metagenome]